MSSDRVARLLLFTSAVIIAFAAGLFCGTFSIWPQQPQRPMRP